MKRIIYNILVFATFIVIATFLFNVPPVSASVLSDACSEGTVNPEGNNVTSGSSVCKSQGADNPVNKTLGSLVTLISFIAGSVAVLIIIWAGFQFIIGNGDPAKIAKARQTILYAVIGLVVIISSNLIVQFVVSKL